MWHWLNALAILVLCVSGYFIGSPPPSMQIAEAAEQFVFGYIRFAHFAAGMVLTIGFLGRIDWAFLGNHHARQLFYVPVWKASFWREVVFELQQPLPLAPYADNAEAGSLIVVDPASHRTSGALLVEQAS